jgi:UMP-CMP kinase
MIPIVQEIITERVRGGKETFLFTGFPRTVNQLRYFEQMILDFKNESNTKSFFIEYRITDQIMESRSKERRKKSSLSWDTDDGIKRRGNLYYKDIEPMIKVLQAEGKLITIDGSRSEDEIYRETISLLETYRISKER